jgi:hypothetical protein
MTTQVRITVEHAPGTKVRVTEMSRIPRHSDGPVSWRDLKDGETFVDTVYEGKYFTVEEKPA